MRFGTLAVLAGGTALVSLITGYVPGVLIGGGVLVYLLSLLIAPKRKCRSCTGAGVHGDPVGSSAIRRCWTCHGRKEYARLGTRLLRPKVYQGIQSGQHGRNW
jgi:hypothetical protein